MTICIYVGLFSNLLAIPLSSDGEKIFNSLRMLRGRPTDKYGMLGHLINQNEQYENKFISQNHSFNIIENEFDQKLDHFDPSNDATWKQRYFAQMDVFDNSPSSKSPIFLMLGGEGQAPTYFLKTGQMVKNAKHYKAAMVMLEHRYYGEKHPTRFIFLLISIVFCCIDSLYFVFSDTSVAGLKYLSSEQALADAAAFVKFFKQKYDLNKKHKWIVFGGILF